MKLDRLSQHIQDSYSAADKVHARGELLRAALEANPGKWPEVEKDGLRPEQHGDGDPHDELDKHEQKLKERDGR